MYPGNRPTAVVWDYDGTLVDTRHKNLNVTRTIVSTVTGTDDFPSLRSVADYHAATVRATNWRSFYATEFGFRESQIEEAGAMWTELQLEDATEVPFLAGIEDAIRDLAHLPHGVVSQNSSDIIRRRLTGLPPSLSFGCIIGFEEVDPQRQKPDPEGLLLCVKRLAGDHESGYAFYIGDHETDSRCVANANDRLRRKGDNFRLISIAACYGDGTDPDGWEYKPDFTARQAADLVAIIDGDRSNGED